MLLLSCLTIRIHFTFAKNNQPTMKTTLLITGISLFLLSFFTSCSEEDNPEIVYPETVSGALNVLNENNSVFEEGFDTNYCFHAVTPKGMKLKIKMEFMEGVNLPMGYWGYSLSSLRNWVPTTYDPKHFQYFEVVDSGKLSNLKMSFYAGKGVKIRISYFENDDLVPTRSRIITVN